MEAQDIEKEKKKRISQNMASIFFEHFFICRTSKEQQ